MAGKKIAVSAPAAEPPEGWGWPLAAAKAHYFVSARSLCGRWAFAGEKLGSSPTHGADDCQHCARRLEKRQAKAEKAAKVAERRVMKGAKG